MIVEREKWRAKLPSRWEEVVVGLIAVLYVVRAEAWEKRREEDSVAVLELAGCCLSIRNTMTADGEDSNYA